MTAPAGCPEPAVLAAAIRELVGRDFDPKGMHLDIVAGASGQWRALLSLPEGQRPLEGESCAALVDATAVIVALSLERRLESVESSTAARVAPSADTVSVAPVPASREESIAESPAEGAPSARPLSVMLHVGLLGEIGLLPAPSLGPRLLVTFERGLWSVNVGGAFLLARQAALRSGEAADIHWFGGQVAACRSVKGPLRACFGGEAGQVVGTGSGVDEPITNSGSWLAVTAEASFRGTVAERLGWELGVGAAAALMRPEFGFEELGVLHRASSVSGRFFGGVGWR